MITRVRITLFGSVEWQVTVMPDALKRAEGLPSGQFYTMTRKVGDVQTEDVLIRPYYRRIINDELHIFAVQVMPKEDKRHGK